MTDAADITDERTMDDADSPSPMTTDPARLTVWTDATLGTVGMTRVTAGENGQVPVDAIAVR